MTTNPLRLASLALVAGIAIGAWAAWPVQAPASPPAPLPAMRLTDLDGRAVAYTTRTGHLIARHPVSAAAQASMFYVAYLADGAAATTRPVTFFFNGGPGSASVWLHLGSYGPRRLATGVPAVAQRRVAARHGPAG